jgi:hypothetical protein
VASFFKHLGVLVGPGAVPTRWTPAFAKFLDRALCIKSAGGGLSESIRMYGALAVSTLQYIGQFCSPPPAIRKIEARAIARITSSPLYAFPISLGSGLQEIGLRPGFTHIETMSHAAQIRAISSSKHLPTILALTDVAADGVCPHHWGERESPPSSRVPRFNRSAARGRHAAKTVSPLAP